MRIANIFERDVKVASFSAGDTIFAEGEPGDAMYVVKVGEVDIRVHGRTVETVGPEGIFGEMALIDNQPRSAAAVAKTDCKLAPIDQKRFTFLVQEVPMFALQVMEIMAARLRRKNE
jgi:CRP/FNR family transcriptional regulator, cyclic AMP receptor protein